MIEPSFPGSLRSSVDPNERQAWLDKLAITVSRLTEEQQRPPQQPVKPFAGEKPQCFIIMPFGQEELDIVYEYFVLPVLEEVCNLICRRGDESFGSNVIIDDVRTAIEETHLIVADITGQNPNVFYEVGISHTLDKPVLLLSQSPDDIPFNVRHLRVLPYEYTPKGCKLLERKLKEHIFVMLEELGFEHDKGS